MRDSFLMLCFLFKLELIQMVVCLSLTRNLGVQPADLVFTTQNCALMDGLTFNKCVQCIEGHFLQRQTNMCLLQCPQGFQKDEDLHYCAKLPTSQIPKQSQQYPQTYQISKNISITTADYNDPNKLSLDLAMLLLGVLIVVLVVVVMTVMLCLLFHCFQDEDVKNERSENMRRNATERINGLQGENRFKIIDKNNNARNNKAGYLGKDNQHQNQQTDKNFPNDIEIVQIRFDY